MKFSSRGRLNTHLIAIQKVNRQQLQLAVHQRQEGNVFPLVPGGIDPRVRFRRHERAKVAPRVTERNRRRYAEALLPQQRQVDALEARVADIFAAEALNAFDTVHDNRPSQNVSQGENVQLLQRRAGLTSERKQRAPVFLELGFRNGVVKQRCLENFVLLPARVEAVGRKGLFSRNSEQLSPSRTY